MPLEGLWDLFGGVSLSLWVGDAFGGCLCGCVRGCP